MPTSNEIRKQFIDFFISKGHTFIPSSSVVPFDDPTLLFTNAGMNQFKDIFLGNKETDTLRAVNSQKCIRAGGKHNDLDEVGKDGYHHTFFEMLGNWSFGDYYKKDAIKWAWELFTEVWKLPKDKLHTTVFTDDDEAFELWKNETDINHKHITRHGEKDNFWEMGETGPCGPCSEIHFDRGIEFCNKKNTPGHMCKVNGDCHRYIELWNLVFMQFLRNDDNSLSPLKNKFVDTGAGFERVCQILQGVSSNYDTDVFTPIIREIETLSNITYTEETGVSHRVIADHIRTLCFAIADGGLPSNEGRGYVLRRILRRAARYGRNLKMTEPFIYKLVDSVVQNMGEHFTEVSETKDFIITIIKAEEERFNQTLDKGLQLFEELISTLKEKTISGQDAFTLYDTYGFPLDLTIILAEEKGLSVNQQEFQIEMEKQKERARNASQFKVNLSEIKWIELIANPEFHSKFIGYELSSCTSHIIKYIIEEHSGENPQFKIILDQTPFYAESGGQIADKGIIHNNKCEIEIYNVQKEGDTFIHYGKLIKGYFNNTLDGAELPFIAMIDKSYRQSIAGNHTATHLLHSALKKVLGEHVQQKGSLVYAEGLRFDFTHFSAMSTEEISLVEDIINEKIRQCLPLQTDIKSIEEAKQEGATALFGEKYGNSVRVVSIYDDKHSFSKELCGGTHVQNTGQIGLFKIINEASSAAGIRRIEATTGKFAENYYKSNEITLQKINHILIGKSSTINEKLLIDKLEKLISDYKKLSVDIESLKLQNSSNLLDDIIKNKKCINQINYIIGYIDVSSPDELKSIGDTLKDKIHSGVGVLYTELDSKISIIVVVTKDLLKKLHSGKIVGELVKAVDGRGGGRPDMAMAGGKIPETKIDLQQTFEDILIKILDN
ncbi:MAG: alanine--tRNA ligase [Candidatus Cloacimonetes bacterium]|nr:alanine--tRNA ligase [Candidatus Cloacimonadota bacterium]